MLTLERVDAAKAALEKAITLTPDNPQAWYNLGLAEHSDNELDEALKSFQTAVKLDPRDADSYYFEGACYSELKEYGKAMETLREALKVNPLHASAEFQLARALQRSGDTQDAREHFKVFQHMTSTKISSPIGLAYGEQGHYSTVTPIMEPETRPKAMIPVKLVAESMAREDANAANTGGACMLDVTGSGCDGPCSHASGKAGDRDAAQHGRRQVRRDGCGECGVEGERTCGCVRGG